MQHSRHFAAIGLALTLTQAGCSDADVDAGNVSEALAVATVEPAPAGDAAPGVAASVAIKPWSVGSKNDNTVTGSLQFAPTTTGLELSGALKNLPKGLHGLHIHANGDCSNPGEHFAPAANRHGDPSRGEHHLGDLGNVEADSANQANVSINVQGLALQGKSSILGHALVVHAGEDDLHSQPAGNSGDVIGCGIIEADGDAEVRTQNRAAAAG